MNRKIKVEFIKEKKFKSPSYKLRYKILKKNVNNVNFSLIKLKKIYNKS